MKHIITPATVERTTSPLVIGERLTQPEFHKRYEAYEGQEKFELIRGIVFMASPLRIPHGVYHEQLSFILGLYWRATPGVEQALDTTAILGEKSEPRPDL